jgi:signal transduction histidine kinase
MRWLAQGGPRPVPAGLLDSILAVALSVGAMLDVARLPTGSPVLLASALALACTASVSTRRRYPVGSAVAALAAAACYELVTHDPRFTFEPYAVVLALFMVGRTELRGGPLRHRSVLVAAVPAFAAMARGAGGGVGLTFGGWALFALIPYVVGVLVERRALTSISLATETELLLGEHELRARTAQVQERLHVARELHDVVAHCLTEMVIQAGAARIVLHDDAAAARNALLSVASSGRTAGADLGRVVGGQVDERWSASRLLELLEATRHAGVEVDWVGMPRGVFGPVDATGFRVVQEALTNAARHAPGAAVTVRVRADARALDIAVVNGPVPHTRRRLGRPGFGVVGMRERVVGAGGWVDVGPTPTGGYAVHATLPWEVPPGSGSARTRSVPPLSGKVSPLLALAVPVGWLVALAADALTSTHRAGPLTLNLLVVAAMAISAVLRRRRPVAFLAVVGVLALCLTAGLTGRSYGTLTGLYSVLVPTYALGSWAPRRTAVVALAVWASIATVTGLVQHAPLGGLVGPLMAAAIATAVGMIARSQREVNTRLAAGYAAARSECQRLEKLAADRERARLAGQLHAPVAQIVTRMVDSADEAVGLLDAGHAHVSVVLERIENDGREALTQMRHVLGALRSASASAAATPSYDAPGDPEQPASAADVLRLPA